MSAVGDKAAVAQSTDFCQSNYSSSDGEPLLKKIINWLRGASWSPDTTDAVLLDPLLGPMKKDQSIKGLLISHIRFEDRYIELYIDPDGEILEECLKVARRLTNSLVSLDQAAKSVASRDLLHEYNENWRFFGITRSDGTLEDVARPALTRSEFEASILLSGVNVTGNMLAFCYSDESLFAGHSIFVEAFDGLAFNDTHATLFG